MEEDNINRFIKGYQEDEVAIPSNIPNTIAMNMEGGIKK